MREISDFSSVYSAGNVRDQVDQPVAGFLLAAFIFHATAATALLPHKLLATEIVDVFVAGAFPGLIMTLVLCLARPGLCDCCIRRQTTSVLLPGTAILATVPLITAGV